MKRLALLVFAIACGSKAAPPAEAPASPPPSEPGADTAGECITTGCSGTICAEPGQEVMTTCEMKPEYACYKTAVCERQADGSCGWTQTPDLQTCLTNPPPL